MCVCVCVIIISYNMKFSHLIPDPEDILTVDEKFPLLVSNDEVSVSSGSLSKKTIIQEKKCQDVENVPHVGMNG